jgi:hypothetical protein
MPWSSTDAWGFVRKPTKHSSILKLFAETRDEDIVGRTSIAGGMHEGAIDIDVNAKRVFVWHGRLVVP